MDEVKASAQPSRHSADRARLFDLLGESDERLPARPDRSAAPVPAARHSAAATRALGRVGRALDDLIASGS